MSLNADLIVQDLLNQIASLSRDKSIYYALSVQKDKENKQLKEEISELKNEIEKLKDKKKPVNKSTKNND